MGKEALVLLRCRPAHSLVELSSITSQQILVLVGAFEALLSSLVVVLQQLKESFIGVKKHLILLDIDILWRYRMLSEVCTDHDAEGVLANHILLNTFHTWKAPLLTSSSTVIIGSGLIGCLYIASARLRSWLRVGLNLLLLLYDVLEILEHHL